MEMNFGKRSLSQNMVKKIFGYMGRLLGHSSGV